MTNSSRWFILRLLFSLLALPVAAFFVLWLLHEIIFPNAGFNDLPVVVMLWFILFEAVNLVLRRSGISRYDYLQKHAQLALEANQTDDLEQVHDLTRKLFSSGFLPHNLVANLQRDSRRQFLTFHERHLNAPEALDELRLALREGYRREEIYTLLRNHLLSQPVLTTRFIDLAEELLEHRPDDAQLLDHLVHKFVDNRAWHHRAEYFYQRHLEENGRLTPTIISMCLENLVAKKRQDNFALWIYVRAFEAGQTADSTLRRLLFEAHQQQQTIGRNDRLAVAVAKIAATFSPEEFAAPPAKERRAVVDPAVLERWKQMVLAAWQIVAGFYSRLQPVLKELYTRHRRYVLTGAGALVLISSLAIILANRTEMQAPVPVVEQEENLAGYFALQVGAWKKSRSAELEREKLQAAGLRVRILEPRSSAGWYRIHVGKYATRNAAQAAADSLKRKGVIDDYFITEYQSK